MNIRRLSEQQKNKRTTEDTANNRLKTKRTTEDPANNRRLSEQHKTKRTTEDPANNGRPREQQKTKRVTEDPANNRRPRERTTTKPRHRRDVWSDNISMTEHQSTGLARIFLASVEVFSRQEPCRPGLD
jgi:hypothetical protein